MEKKIHDFFERETMPESCVRRIEETLNAKPSPSPRYTRWAAATAALLTVLALGNWNSIRVHAEDIYDRIIQTIAPDLVPLGQINDFCEVRNGRLYFTGAGKQIDITDQCSDEIPYIHVVQEGDILWYLVVGGTPENYGSMKTTYDLTTGTWGLLGAWGHGDGVFDAHYLPAWLENAMTQIGFK